jgi:tRNA modification GTPase
LTRRVAVQDPMARAEAPTPRDTIVARATPAGRGAVAVIRLSGPAVPQLALQLLGALPRPRHATLAAILGQGGEAIDLGLALYFPAPHSFTGEEVLELHAHGGTVVTELIIERALALGARMARPGEFTERAFLNDKLDLAQAEAIADLIDAGSAAAARAAQRALRGDFSAAVLSLNEQVTGLRTWVEAAIDFPDEDVDFLDSEELRRQLLAVDAAFGELERTVRQGCLLRDGIRVAIVGRPNAGKSSILNALAGYEAAIVTPVPGTTRDLVREELEVDGMPVHVVDTAGLRSSNDVVEQEGVRRARAELAAADHAIVVVDATTDVGIDSLLGELPAGLARTIVRNKIDLTADPPGNASPDGSIVNVSALTGAGLSELRRRIGDVAGFHPAQEGMVTARRRHLESLQKAREHFDAACRELGEHQAGELMADELLQVQNALAEITGEFTSDDLLGRIFASFCIGK